MKKADSFAGVDRTTGPTVPIGEGVSLTADVLAEAAEAAKRPPLYQPDIVSPAEYKRRGYTQALPRIVRFLETRDCPDSSCPHCGANGRYILTFQVEDGRTLGAMRGCVKLFPVSPVAVEELRLRTKAADYEKKGWSLNRRDQEAVEAIEAFYAGTRNERHTLATIRFAKQMNQARFRR